MTREKPYYKPCNTCTNEYCVFMGTEDTHSICEDYKPLEQKHCSDAISRQAVLDFIKGWSLGGWVEVPESKWTEFVIGLPSVNPTPNISIQITEREKYGRFN